MKKLTDKDRIDAVFMHCPVELLGTLLEHAQLIAKIRNAGTEPVKRHYVRKPKDETKEAQS